MNYLHSTRSPLYSFIFALPMVGLYEIGLILLSREELPNLRNAADVLMRQALEMFGVIGYYGSGLVFIFGLLIVYLVQKHSWTETEIQGNYFMLMLIESFMWSWVLYGFMTIIQTPFLMSPSSRIVIQQVVLSVGAGIYEEFVFRVLLITGFMSVLSFVFQWETILRRVGAVIGAAVLFSLFHFIGGFGENPNLSLFIIRFMAGLFLGALYTFRGFGITACAHAMYDLILVTQTFTGE